MKIINLAQVNNLLWGRENIRVCFPIWKFPRYKDLVCVTCRLLKEGDHERSLLHRFSAVLRVAKARDIFSSSNVITAFCNKKTFNLFLWVRRWEESHRYNSVCTGNLWLLIIFFWPLVRCLQPWLWQKQTFCPDIMNQNTGKISDFKKAKCEKNM